MSTPAGDFEPYPKEFIYERFQPPSDVDAFITWVGNHAAMYGGDLNWREKERLKADMMNEPARWKASRVTPSALRDKCMAVGLRAEDTDLIVDWLRKRQAGRWLRPRYYKDYRFPQDPTDD